jgi:hypothetical protein
MYNVRAHIVLKQKPSFWQELHFSPNSIPYMNISSIYIVHIVHNLILR